MLKNQVIPSATKKLLADVLPAFSAQPTVENFFVDFDKYILNESGSLSRRKYNIGKPVFF